MFKLIKWLIVVPIQLMIYIIYEPIKMTIQFCAIPIIFAMDLALWIFMLPYRFIVWFLNLFTSNR